MTDAIDQIRERHAINDCRTYTVIHEEHRQCHEDCRTLLDRIDELTDEAETAATLLRMYEDDRAKLTAELAAANQREREGFMFIGAMALSVADAGCAIQVCRDSGGVKVSVREKNLMAMPAFVVTFGEDAENRSKWVAVCPEP